MPRRFPLVVAAALILAVGLAGCMDQAPEPADANTSDEGTALEDSSTREQFEGSGSGGGDGGPVIDLPEATPGAILTGLVGLAAMGCRRA